jgi:hypothetical protein
MTEEPGSYRMPIHSVGISQATGMISAQSDCSVTTAGVLMHRRAELIGCTLGDVATAVLGLRMRFER